MRRTLTRLLVVGRRVSIAATFTAAVATSVVNGYLAVLTAFAWRSRRAESDEPVGRTDDPGTNRLRHRFAVLVPAHDEASTIGTGLQSLIDDPQVGPVGSGSPVTVHVVADNCTDATAEVARAFGVDVHERTDHVRRGKGPALSWLLQRVVSSSDVGERPDVMVIIDADTTVDPGFFSAMDRAIAGSDTRAGGPTAAWQGYYTVRDADSSDAVALRTLALVLRHRVRPQGRCALGGSSGLFGNGMAIRTDVLQRRSFSAHLTEDVEYQLELLLDGMLVDFVPDAVVRAEMPTDVSAITSQNERWEAGRIDVARRFVPRLGRRAVARRTPNRVAVFDALLDQLVPPLSIVLMATAATTASATALASRPIRHRTSAGLSLAASLCLVAHVVGGIRISEHEVAGRHLLVSGPGFVLRKARLWIRMLGRRGPDQWIRTARRAAVESRSDTTSS